MLDAHIYQTRRGLGQQRGAKAIVYNYSESWWLLYWVFPSWWTFKEVEVLVFQESLGVQAVN